MKKIIGFIVCTLLITATAISVIPSLKASGELTILKTYSRSSLIDSQLSTQLKQTVGNGLFHQSDKFVIIAHSTFYDYEGEWDLQRLVDWHNQNDTLTTYMINLADILSNASFGVNGQWGDGNLNNPYKRNDEDAITNYDMFDNSAARIRNYLRYACYDLGVRYALLVGDTDANGEGYIPVRSVYSRGFGAPARRQTIYHEIIPTDMYYACLNGTFNADEDENSDTFPYGGWGENATESADGIDECDWEWEVAIGRFPVDHTLQLSNAVKKTIAYMSLTETEPFLCNVTLAGHYGGWGGQAQWCADYSKTLNATVYNKWWNNATTYGFDPEIYNITVVDENPNREEGIPYTDANARGQFNQGCHVWYQGGHGSYMGWAGGHGGDSFLSDDIQALTNTEYGLVFSSIPCNVANFDQYDDCFIEQFLTDDHGAFAAIGNTRYGWGSYDGGQQGYWNGLNASSHYLGCEFFDAYFNESYRRLGDMLFDSKQDARWWHDQEGEGTIRWAMYEQILMGSPSVKMKLPLSSGRPTPPTITGPSNGITGKMYHFSFMSTDPEEDAIYYYIDWGDDTHSGWVGPYASGETCDASHTWTEPGGYEVRAKAKDVYNVESDWSEPHAITIIEGPILDIGIIKGGLFKVSAPVKNTGAVDATGVNWSITLNGGAFIGKETTGKEDIPLGGEITVTSKLILGLGSTTVTVTAELAEGVSDTREQTGFVFLFFIKVNPGG